MSPSVIFWIVIFSFFRLSISWLIYIKPPKNYINLYKTIREKGWNVSILKDQIAVKILPSANTTNIDFLSIKKKMQPVFFLFLNVPYFKIGLNFP